MQKNIYLILCFVFFTMLGLTACHKKSNVYISGCNDGHTFKKVRLNNLVDSLSSYDNQYVEITGTYKQGKDDSELFSDKPGKVLWVEFSNECPLYLTGTRIGFFDYDNNNGQLTPADNKTIIVRGQVNYNNKGHLKAYKGAIDHISYVKL